MDKRRRSRMPTGIKINPSPPMRKWCRMCEKFKPNPKRKINPMYCEDCLDLILQKKYNKKRTK